MPEKMDSPTLSHSVLIRSRGRAGKGPACCLRRGAIQRAFVKLSKVAYTEVVLMPWQPP